MIDYYIANKYCCEDISLIENYDKASKDLIQTWDIHHRMGNEGYSMQELIDKGLYYGRPASELIFIKHSEHMSLHNKGKKKSKEHRIKIGKSLKGRTPWDKGKKRPEFSGEKHPNSKPINQIDKNTCQIIRTWPCAYEVQRVLGIQQSNISACCSGKLKSCGGYIWRYADI